MPFTPAINPTDRCAAFVTVAVRRTSPVTFISCWAKGIRIPSRPVGLGSARQFAEHLARPVLSQKGDLSVDALGVHRYLRVAENHGFVLHQNSATKKANRIKGLILVRNS